jgi:hypothetical protein
MRGLDNAKTTQELLDAMRIHYNFIRPHQSLGNQTSAEVAGIDLNLKENKVENLMRQVALNQKEVSNMEPFLFELGFKVHKLHIIRKDDSIEIKPKEWIDKKNWREINETLVKYEFKWLSYGKDSCWIKQQQ